MTIISGVSKEDEMFALVGKISTEASNLEFIMLRFISVLLFKNLEDGVSVFNGINFSILHRILLPIYYSKIKSDKYDEIINNLSYIIKTVIDKRNIVVHSIWAFNERTLETKRAAIHKRGGKEKPNRKSNFHFVQEDAETLKQLLVVLKKAKFALMKLEYKITTENLIK